MSWLRYRYTDEGIVGIFDSGKEMIFDKEDLEIVSARPWFIDETGYPSARDKETGERTRLHRMLLKGEIPEGKVVDHINRNKLDNRRSNLRVCTQQTNVRNASRSRTNKSGVTGVFYDTKTGRWRAQISRKGQSRHIGSFDDFEDAVRARKEAEKSIAEKEGDSNLLDLS